MNILMLSTDPGAFTGGSSVRERFVQLGNIVEMLHIIILTSEGYTEESIAQNVFLHPTNSKSKWRRLTDAYRIGKTLRYPDIVTAQNPFETGFVGWRLSKFHSAALELQVHTDFLSPYFKRHSFKNKIRVFLARLLLPKADGVRVVSKRIKESIKRAALPRTSEPQVLPVFIDTVRAMTENSDSVLSARYPEFDFIVLTAGRLESEKNVELGLLVMKKVIAAYPRTGYLIVGEGSEKRKLEEITMKLSLDQNVLFLGHERDVMPYYQSAGLYLSTSNYEGYGLSLIEAALSGCPIVTTDVGVVGEILKDSVSALVCPPDDAHCLSKKIILMMGDVELRKRLKRAALAEALSVVWGERATYLAEQKKSWENIVFSVTH